MKFAPLVLGIAVVLVLGMGLLMIPRGSDAQPALQGTLLNGKQAPDFRLRDQFGRFVTLRSLRGRPVILTFSQATCTQLCPVVAETIRRGLAEMGSGRQRVAVVAVSTDPEHDTPDAVRAFSLQHHLLHRWHYLTGRRPVLAPIWRDYYLYVAPPSAPAKLRQSHTSATYLIDAQGRERVLMGGDPPTGWLVRDLRILAGMPVSTPLVSTVPAPQVGHPAPGFSARSLTASGPVSLRALRGRIVVLNFWATWCHACRSEMPRLSAWYRKLQGQGLVILGVDNGEPPDTARTYAKKLHIAYPVLADPNGVTSAMYDVTAMPTTVLVDRRGVVASVHLGVLDPTYLRSHIVPLLTARG